MAVQQDYSAGDLNYPIRIEQPSYASTGDEISEWTRFREPWSKIEPVQGRELPVSDREMNESWVDFVIRYDTPLPTTKMRVVDLQTDTVYDIREVQHSDGGRKWIRLKCRSVQ